MTCVIGLTTPILQGVSTTEMHAMPNRIFCLSNQPWGFFFLVVNSECESYLSICIADGQNANLWKTILQYWKAAWICYCESSENSHKYLFSIFRISFEVVNLVLLNNLLGTVGFTSGFINECSNSSELDKFELKILTNFLQSSWFRCRNSNFNVIVLASIWINT